MKSIYKYLPALIFFVAVTLVFNACSTKKNTWTSRQFHQTTTHFNYWFNANERVKEAVKRFNQTQPEKYEKILPIFKLGDDAQARALNPDMDEAMKKASVAITRHSMFIKNVEYNRWIDDCYMLIGKAEFYKHDYWTAIETFQFIATTYKDNPSRFEALIWLAQTYMQLGKMIDAEFVLDYLKNEKKLPKELKAQYGLVAADYYLKKNDYQAAIDGLEKAVPELKKRNDRIRYTFILAQLYQKVDSTEKAYAYYEKVIKLNPPYEMAFNAKINRARNFDAASASAADVKKQLNKMLKDDKNIEYQDQIYYALAGVAEKQGDEPTEVEMLKKSVATSAGNNSQKGLSYLDLGKINLSHRAYRIASAYYDSCMAIVAKDFPDYKDINDTKMSLRKLVDNLVIIEQQDSLVKLYNMTESERSAFLDDIIKKENEERERKKAEEARKKEEALEGQNLVNDAMNKKFQTNQSQPGAGGAWYFYNQATMSFGLNEFFKRWGNDRKLEDNWRRAERLDAGSGEDATKVDSASLALTDSISKLSDEKRKSIYAKGIPATDKEIAAINEKIIEAYYNVAIIYKEQLKDLPQSIATYEELLKRFPENKYKLPCYYQLFRNYLIVKDQEKSDYYKNLILTKYPDSEFALLIKDPEYYLKLKTKTEVLQVFYENTYKAYENRQYTAVIERKAQAEEMYPKNKLMPKFDLLRTLSIGHLKPVNEFELSLRDIIRNYPNDSVSVRAKEILDYIIRGGQPQQINPGDPKPVQDSGFVYEPDSAHFFLLIFDSNKINVNQLKTKISDFNSTYYSTADLSISNAFLTPVMQYIMVKQFNNANTGQNYYDGILSDDNVFGEIEVPFKSFLITQGNFTKLFLKKELTKYEQFFEKMYNSAE